MSFKKDRRHLFKIVHVEFKMWGLFLKLKLTINDTPLPQHSPVSALHTSASLGMLRDSYGITDEPNLKGTGESQISHTSAKNFDGILNCGNIFRRENFICNAHA